MKKILTGSQKSFLNNQQPKTPIGSGNNAHITTDGTSLMIKNLDTVAELGDDFETLAINKRTRKVVKSPGGAGGAGGGTSFMNHKGTWTATADPNDARCLGASLPANPAPGDAWVIDSSGFSFPDSMKFTHGNYPSELAHVGFIVGDTLFFSHDNKWRIIPTGHPSFPRGYIRIDIEDIFGDPVTIPANDSVAFGFSYSAPHTSKVYGDSRATATSGGWNAYTILYALSGNLPAQPTQFPQLRIFTQGGTGGSITVINDSDVDLTPWVNMPPRIFIAPVLAY